MTDAQELLAQKDVLQAIRTAHLKKQIAAQVLQDQLVEVYHKAVAPVPEAKTRLERYVGIARSIFGIWQGVSLGIKVARGFHAAFRRKR